MYIVNERKWTENSDFVECDTKVLENTDNTPGLELAHSERLRDRVDFEEWKVARSKCGYHLRIGQKLQLIMSHMEDGALLLLLHGTIDS